MFNCGHCGTPTGPKIKQIPVVVKTVPATYLNYQEDDIPGRPTKITNGFETAEEIKACPTCAEVTITPVVVPDFKMEKAVGRAMAAHAAGCKKTPNECKTCKQFMNAMGSFSLPGVNHALSEVPTIPLTTSMASVIVANLLKRADDSERGKSARAGHDFEAAYPVMKAYEERGGTL